MSMSHRDDVLRQAMALPFEDRAFVVTALERSLSGDGESEAANECEDGSDGISGAALLEELQRRSAAYRAGTSTARPASVVLADLKARQARERSP